MGASDDRFGDGGATRPDLPRLDYEEDEDPEERLQTVLHRGLADRPETRLVPYLVVVGGEHSIGRVHRVEGSLIIGRAGSCDIQLTEDGVSRRHARAVAEPGGTVELQDLGSSNGILYRGQRVSSQRLSDGDRVRVGGATLTLIRFEDRESLLRENLRESATLDPQTRLLARATLISILEKGLARAARSGAPLSVVACVVEATTEQVSLALRRVGELARHLIRRESVAVARGGNDCVAVVLPDTGRDEASSAAEWVRTASAWDEGSSGDLSDERAHGVPVKVGVALSTEAATAEELLSLARSRALQEPGGR